MIFSGPSIKVQAATKFQTSLFSSQNTKPGGDFQDILRYRSKDGLGEDGIQEIPLLRRASKRYFVRVLANVLYLFKASFYFRKVEMDLEGLEEWDGEE